MNKKKIIIVALVFFIGLIGSVLGISGVVHPYKRAVKLGYKYIKEEKYEPALLAFDKAIEIDEKSAEAYIGKAEVYVSRCDGNALKDIQEVLSYAAACQDQQLADDVIRLSDRLYEKEEKTMARNLLYSGYSLAEENKQILNKLLEIFLSELYDILEKSEGDFMDKFLQSDEYRDFMALVEEVGDSAIREGLKYSKNPVYTYNGGDGEFKYIYIPDSNKKQTGKGIGLYYQGIRLQECTQAPIFIYYGDFISGARSGKGVWLGSANPQWFFRKDVKRYYCFEGSWSQDMPNGFGKEMWDTLVPGVDLSNMNDEKGETQLYKRVIEGNYVNGLLDGTFSMTEYTLGRGVHLYEHVVAKQGTLLHSGCTDPLHNYSSSYYCVAVGKIIDAKTKQPSDKEVHKTGSAYEKYAIYSFEK